MSRPFKSRQKPSEPNDPRILVDPEDLDLLKRKWNIQPSHNTFYARRIEITETKRIRLALHRLILSRILNRSLLRKDEVDHINGDGLDNRRCNLRLAERHQNARNCRMHKDNTTGFKGVSQCKDRFRAYITYDKHTRALGYFRSAIDAGIAYNHEAYKCFGSFANLNKIDGWENTHPVPCSNRASSGYPGVYANDNKAYPWKAEVRVNGVQVKLGVFATAEEANRAITAAKTDTPILLVQPQYPENQP
jgi:hypothetical protein